MDILAVAGIGAHTKMDPEAIAKLIGRKLVEFRDNVPYIKLMKAQESPENFEADKQMFLDLMKGEFGEDKVAELVANYEREKHGPPSADSA